MFFAFYIILLINFNKKQDLKTANYNFYSLIGNWKLGEKQTVLNHDLKKNMQFFIHFSSK